MVLQKFMFFSQLPSGADETESKCSEKGEIHDLSDLVQWLKRGKPPISCSYNRSESSFIQNSMARPMGYVSIPAIPLDDGFSYSFK